MHLNAFSQLSSTAEKKYNWTKEINDKENLPMETAHDKSTLENGYNQKNINQATRK